MTRDPTSRVPADLRVLMLDFDGVLADSMPLQEQAWRAAAHGCAVRPEVEAALIENLYRGAAGPSMFKNVPVSRPERTKLRAAKDSVWRASWERVPLAVGAARVLRGLPRDLAIGIATTAPRTYVELILKRHGLESAVKQILTNEDVVNPKPHPEMLHGLLTQFQTAPQRTLMVGDSLTDCVMSASAGVPFVLMNLHDRERHRELADVMWVDGWDELSSLLTRRTRAETRHSCTL